jgi:preprotein translocase subunit SecD
MIALSRWKIVVCALGLVFGVLFSLPNLLPRDVVNRLPGWMPRQTLNLGLDLQGGSYLLLEVDVAALKREKIVNLIEDVRSTLRDARIDATGLGRAGDAVTVRITDPAKIAAARTALGKLAEGAQDNQPLITVNTAPDQRLTLALSPTAMEGEGKRAVEQSIEIIRRRLDPSGSREISIAAHGADRIVLQAPGENDPERLKRLIGQTAKLTFQMVETVSPEEAASGALPPDIEVLPTEEAEQDGSNVIALNKRALVTGEMLQTAGVSFDQYQQPVVTFRFNGQGSRRFATATSENVGRRFAIVLDKKVISAPRINEPITGGSGQISGNFTVETANELAVLLRAGALPAPLNVEEQRTVGAELGADAIRAGQVATAVGAVAIVAFMIMAYGLFGVFAVIALVVNSLLIVAIMSLSQATLTLPGIAGLVLTLAVAVDANVLIYERMRDEVRAGRSPILAADAGYSRAMSTIIDANVTSLVAAVIMIVVAGAGPVKGFAVTLTIGIFTSALTAVLITQVLIGWWFRAFRPKKLPIA